MADYLGWVATGIFASSYFFTRPMVLRRVQMAGALLWVCYGALMHALPVVAANLLVLAAAGWSERRSREAAGPVGQ